MESPNDPAKASPSLPTNAGPPDAAATPGAPEGTQAPDATALYATTPLAKDTAVEPSHAGPASQSKIKVDRLGEFVLLKKLGEGAMGAVFQARQESLDRIVALKVMSAHLAGDPTFVQRFQREARVMARLEHPNILHCYAVGEDRGFHYLAMEYVDGGSLGSLLRKVGKLSVGDALHVIIAAATGLQHAHELDMIHRDIKPDNILITSKGIVKVADLGLAKAMTDDMSLTRTGSGAGTPVYMSPEQARDSKHVDGRSDIYSLGCMLYRCLVGKPPFQGETYIEIFEAKERNIFAPARKSNNEVPEMLDLYLTKMLAKDPRVRYQTCADVIRDLNSLGLANSTLSFIGAPDGSAATPASTRTKAASRPGPAGARTEAVGDWWYVRALNFDGVRKLTKKQVIDFVLDKNFDWKAEASRSPTGEFRAIASYGEFEGAVRGRVARIHADRKASRYKSKFNELIQEEDARRRRRKLEKLLWTIGRWIILILVLAGLGVGGFYGYKAAKAKLSTVELNPN